LIGKVRADGRRALDARIGDPEWDATGSGPAKAD
jgi:hypothetical protein